MSRTPDGKFAPGNRGGPGRPQRSVRAALKRVVDIDALALRLWEMATGKDVRDAQWAIDTILNRLEGRPIARSDVRMASVSFQLPAGWESMSALERGHWADSMRAKALAGEIVEGDEDE